MQEDTQPHPLAGTDGAASCIPHPASRTLHPGRPDSPGRGSHMQVSDTESSNSWLCCCLSSIFSGLFSSDMLKQPLKRKVLGKTLHRGVSLSSEITCSLSQCIHERHKCKGRDDPRGTFCYDLSHVQEKSYRLDFQGMLLTGCRTQIKMVFQQLGKSEESPGGLKAKLCLHQKI